MSPERAAALTHTMYEIEYTLPDSKAKRRQILAMSDEQCVLYHAVLLEK